MSKNFEATCHKIKYENVSFSKFNSGTKLNKNFYKVFHKTNFPKLSPMFKNFELFLNFNLLKSAKIFLMSQHFY